MSTTTRWTISKLGWILPPWDIQYVSDVIKEIARGSFFASRPPPTADSMLRNWFTEDSIYEGIKEVGCGSFSASRFPADLMIRDETYVGFDIRMKRLGLESSIAGSLQYIGHSMPIASSRSPLHSLSFHFPNEHFSFYPNGVFYTFCLPWSPSTHPVLTSGPYTDRWPSDRK